MLKYKLWKMQKILRDRSQTERQERDYVCPKCHQRFSQLDVTAYVYGPKQLFRCPYHRPDEAFYLQLEGEKESESHVKLTLFMTKMDPLVQLLKKAEGVKIPHFDPKAALAEATAVATRLAEAKQAADATQLVKVVRATNRRQGPGITQLSEVEESEERMAVVVDIQDEQTLSAEKQAQNEVEKDRKRKQNALPFWHQSSTIGAFDQTAHVEKSETLNVAAVAVGSALTASNEQLVSSEVDETPAISVVVDEEENADIMTYYENYYKSFAKTEQKQMETQVAEKVVDSEEPVASSGAKREISGAEEAKESNSKRQKTEDAEDDESEEEEFIDAF